MSSPDEPAPTQRIHLYGASNLWLSRRTALTAVRRRFEGPLEIGLACGPGRSYGLNAGNPIARYRALREVEFPRPTKAPTLSVLSDVGNDIAYAQSPETTVSWVADLAARLEGRGDEVVLTGVPLESLRTLPDWLFLIVRALYYAGDRVSREEVLQRLADLEGGLEALGRERGYPILATDSRWYGFDRFHLRPSQHLFCWEGWMDRLRPVLGESPLPALPSVWKAHPETYWYRGQSKQAVGEYHGLLPQTKLIVR